MHQIRGRVGRSSTQAYAYFLYPKNGSMTQTAIERLSSIKQHSALGSGFQLAKKDLEIRGAGNLLGVEQSGQIEGVGFDLFMKMLSEEINRLKKSAQKSRIGAADTASPTPKIPKSTATDTNSADSFTIADSSHSTVSVTETADQVAANDTDSAEKVTIADKKVSDNVTANSVAAADTETINRDSADNVTATDSEFKVTTTADTSHPTVTDTFDSTAADTETDSETPVQPLHRITQIAIPREYISNDVLRLEMYQKLSNSHTRQELQLVLEEMTDRYGPLPPEFSLD
jgi:hypothetical protein